MLYVSNDAASEAPSERTDETTQPSQTCFGQLLALARTYRKAYVAYHVPGRVVPNYKRVMSDVRRRLAGDTELPLYLLRGGRG